MIQFGLKRPLESHDPGRGKNLRGTPSGRVNEDPQAFHRIDPDL